MKLPPNVREETDRHGKARYRFRKAGYPSRMVQGEPGTEEFARSYESCFDKNYRPPKRTKPRKRTPKAWSRRAMRQLIGSRIVYFIGCERGPVKIGTTVNLAARLKKLQTGNPAKLKVLAIVRGGASVEASYHERFEAYRLQGEWFAGRPIREEIERLRKATEIAEPSTPEKLPNLISA